MADRVGCANPAALVSAAFAAFGTRDPAAIEATLHPDAELVLEGGLAMLTGERHAPRPAVRAWFEEWFSLTESSEAWTEHSAVVGDRLLAVAGQRSLSVSAGAPGETRFGVVCAFRDGLIARFELYADRHRARTALGLDRWPWDRHEIGPEPFDGPDAVALREELTEELADRYSGDTDPAEPAQAPVVLLVARAPGGRAAGCGALLHHDSAAAEIKHMYVRRSARRQDLSRRLLEQLEREAAARGYASCRLETGIRQPEAMALYRSAGYEEMECFGAYRDAPLSRCFERQLDRPR